MKKWMLGTIPLFVISLWRISSGSPMIAVDSADFDVGVIREGEAKVIKHTFKIKNTGDSVLVIQQVRPG